MREILFRGKRIDNGEWADGSLIYDAENNEAFIVESFEDRAAYLRQVNPETVGQYTGLTDKNGKRIFEGDIVHFGYTGANKGVEGKAVVVFENGKFCVEWGWHKEFVCLDGFANTTIEIIGNIHDNPELIGGYDMAEIKCPCGLREHMDEWDCAESDCEECCPLSNGEVYNGRIHRA